MDESKIQSLREHPIVRLMEDKTSFTLDDLLEGHARIIPQGESPVPPAEYWPIEFSEEGEEKIKRGPGEIRLIQDAALLVWAYSNASRSGEQDEAAWYWRREQGRKAKQRVDSKKGGSQSPKKRWAEELAEELAANYNSFPEAWSAISEDENEKRYDGFDVFREGEKSLIADSHERGRESISKETFRTGYFRKHKKPRFFS